MKGEVIDSVKEDLNRLVDARSRELEDRKRRDNNIVLFNVPEHRSRKWEQNKKEERGKPERHQLKPRS